MAKEWKKVGLVIAGLGEFERAPNPIAKGCAVFRSCQTWMCLRMFLLLLDENLVLREREEKRGPSIYTPVLRLTQKYVLIVLAVLKTQAQLHGWVSRLLCLKEKPCSMMFLDCRTRLLRRQEECMLSSVETEKVVSHDVMAIEFCETTQSPIRE